jgi:hypothetical protein
MVTTRVESLPELINQEDIITDLKKEGYDISSRMLTYWRSKRLLRPLIRLGNNHYYPASTVSQIKELCILRSKAPLQILFVHTIEGKTFNIIEARLIQIDGTAKLILHEENGGRLVQDISEENLNAFTRNYQDN